MATVKELRAEAKRQGHKGYSKMKKAQLEALVGGQSSGIPSSDRDVMMDLLKARDEGRLGAGLPKPKPRRVAPPSRRDREVMMDLLKARDEGRLGAGLPKPKPRRSAPKPPKRVGSLGNSYLVPKFPLAPKLGGFKVLRWSDFPKLKSSSKLATWSKPLYWESFKDYRGLDTVSEFKQHIAQKTNYKGHVIVTVGSGSDMIVWK